MPSGYIPIFIFLAVAIAFPTVTIIVARLIREYRALLRRQNRGGASRTKNDERRTKNRTKNVEQRTERRN